MEWAIGLVHKAIQIKRRAEEMQDRTCLTPQAGQIQDVEPAAPAIPSQDEQPYQPDSKLMSIPLDLTATISDILEPHDALALSLTCKGLHDHLFGGARARFENASREARWKVQTMLEKDLPPDQIYCAFCKTFHTTDEKYRSTVCRGRTSSGRSSFTTHLRGDPVSRLGYLDARAIVNASLFQRPSADDALASLLRRSLSSGTPRRDMWEQTWEARVIGGQLFLRTETWHTAARGRKDRDRFAHSVCGHVHIHARWPSLWVNVSELGRLCRFADSDCVAGTCRTCRADWTMMTIWVDGKKDKRPKDAGWLIKITSWHRLGGVRSPFDPVWARCAGEDRSPKPEWDHWDSECINATDHLELNARGYEGGEEDSQFGKAQMVWMRAEEHGDVLDESALDSEFRSE